LRDSGTLAATTRNEARQFSQGGEHYVELSADGSRVIKHTKDLGFGFTPDVDKEGHIILRPATANEYARRVAAHEKMFPTGLKIVGVNTESAFTTSQKHFAGETMRTSSPDSIAENPQNFHQTAIAIYIHVL
jgi:hypothetical protein